MAILDRLGYRADTATNGLEAVEALQARHYDLVLMDCQMPEMDGFEATRRVRDTMTVALDPRIPIVAVTASAMAADREDCIASGMDDYLSKPVEPERLAQVLDRWLRPAGHEEPADTDAPAEALAGAARR